MRTDLPANRGFLLLGVVVEAALAVAAVALGWVLGVAPAETVAWTPGALGWGAAAAGPPLALFWLGVSGPFRPLNQLLRLVEEHVAPLFRGSRVVDLAAVSAVAGIGEEMLFRGLLQGGIAQWIGPPSGDWIGLAAGAIVFGLAHPISRAYVVVAGLIGAYLGWVWLVSGNLLVPIVTHAMYDFVVLVYVMYYRGRSAGGNDSALQQ